MVLKKMNVALTHTRQSYEDHKFLDGMTSELVIPHPSYDCLACVKATFNHKVIPIGSILLKPVF